MAERIQLAAKTSEAKRENSASTTRKIESPQSMSSPVDQVLYLQRTIGNQAVQRMIKSGALQAKIKIGQSWDKYEQEADRVAEAVMRMPEQVVQRQSIEEEEEEQIQTKPFTEQITPLVQKQVEEEEEEELRRQPIEEEEEELQTKTTSGSIPEVQPNIESNIQSLKGGGAPLSENDRTFFEPRFGHDFSQVRVHTDTKAAEAARDVNARAFTMGKDVVFGKEEYKPEIAVGQQLLAHELTHIVQQGNVEIPSIVQRQGGTGSLIFAKGMIIKDIPGPVNDKSNAQFNLIINNPPPGKYYYFRWSIRDAKNNAYRARSIVNNREVWSYSDSKYGRHIYINTPSLQTMFDKGAGIGCRILCRVLETPGFYHPITESNTRLFSMKFDFKPGHKFIYPKIQETIFKELEYTLYFDQDVVLEAFQSAEPNEVAKILHNLKLRPHLEHINYYRLLLSEMKSDLSEGQWNQFASIIGAPAVTGKTPLQLSTEAKTLFSIMELQIEKPNIPDLIQQMSGVKSTDLDSALTTLSQRYDEVYGHKLHQLSAIVRENGTPDQYLKYLSILHESKLAQALRETDPKIGKIAKEQAELASKGKPSDLTDEEMAGLFATRAIEIALTMLRNSEAQLLRVLTRTRGRGDQGKLDAEIKKTVEVLNRYFDPGIPPKILSIEKYVASVKSKHRLIGLSKTDEEIHRVANLQLQIDLHRLGATGMLKVVDRIEDVEKKIDRDSERITSLKIALKTPKPPFPFALSPGYYNQQYNKEIRDLSDQIENLTRKKFILHNIKREIEKPIQVLGGLKKDGLIRLKEMKGGTAEFDKIRNEALMGVVENIEKARKYLHEGDVKIWLLPPVVTQTQRALGISEKPTNDAQKRWQGVIEENIKAAETDEKKVQEILEILNIGGLILAIGTAIFTGGGSLALYAGLGSEAVNLTTSIYGTSKAYYSALAQEVTYGTGLTEKTRIGDIPPTYQPFYDALLGLGINVALAAFILRSVHLSRQSSRLRAGGKIGTEDIKKIADDLSAQGSKVPREKIIKALENKLEKVQELELKAAKAGPPKRQTELVPEKIKAPLVPSPTSTKAIPRTSALIGRGDRLAQALKWKKPLKGWYDVVVHGSPTSFHVFHNGKWIKIDHRRLATFMKKTGYKGEPVRLISCSSGGGMSPIAKDLSNKIGTKVMAPSDTLWIHPNGNMTIGPTHLKPTGSWNQFSPFGTKSTPVKKVTSAAKVPSKTTPIKAGVKSKVKLKEIKNRFENFKKNIDPKEIKGAPPAGSSRVAGHARSKHGFSSKDQAKILNEPERIFSGKYKKTGREVDIYYKNGDVVITEAGKKESVITAYGKSSKLASKPVNPEKWVNDPDYIEFKKPNEVIYHNKQRWEEDDWP